MSRPSPSTLLENTAEQTNMVGPAVRMNTFYGYGTVLNTVSIQTSNLIGTVIIEGTISDSPDEADWVSIVEKKFPLTGTQGQTTTVGETFRGNWLFVRARLDRSYLVPAGSVSGNYGSVDRVLLDSSSHVIGNDDGDPSSDINGLNLGNGTGVFAGKVGSQLTFRTLTVGPELVLTKTDSEIHLGLSNPNGGLINIGGAGLVSQINFQDATVTKTGSTATVAYSGLVGSGAGEYVQFRYTSGNSGNLSGQDCVVAKSAGVVVNIVDPMNCIVEFSFTQRPNPPSSVVIMGQSYSTNEFTYQNVTQNIPTRKIICDGDAANPQLFGGFKKIVLQLRMVDVGASSGFGQRATMGVSFKF